MDYVNPLTLCIFSSTKSRSRITRRGSRLDIWSMYCTSSVTVFLSELTTLSEESFCCAAYGFRIWCFISPILLPVQPKWEYLTKIIFCGRAMIPLRLGLSFSYCIYTLTLHVKAFMTPILYRNFFRVKIDIRLSIKQAHIEFGDLDLLLLDI
jgi:hypothetical protein